ncbi:MAG: phosphoglycerate kinase [Candidatus Marinimicrobia bacterium]|nr:phosphoglycerate kinase [Candidatus Neomarinimicrobiota bacterium]|tara:strand:- start:3064 stop:4251 length:1188 start_codon:yes stop_codon:yes gene_type:complete
MIRTIKAFDIRGRNVLLRVDYNVPMENGVVRNNFRIRSSLSTIQSCLEGGASIVIMSHMGRPKNKDDIKYSLVSVGEELARLLEMPIKFSEDCISQDAIDTSLGLKAGEIHLLENLRFHKGEVNNDKEFSRQLSRHGHIYINDAFGTAHRSHASNVGVAEYFKHSGIGWLMDKEINFLQNQMNKPNRPLTLILGGAKINSKIKLIENFLNKADNIIIGGGMSFTFMKAMGKNIGGSLFEKSMVPIALDLINKARMKGVKLIFPCDLICSKSIDDRSSNELYTIDDLPKDLMGLDIGPKTIELFHSIILPSETILWNGPMGVFEIEQYAKGTRKLGQILADRASSNTKVIVGGGDTATALELFDLSKFMTHVSTGGGASLQLLSGESLIAIQSLEI